MQIWSCKIGETDYGNVPEGADFPMRQAVEVSYKELTGEEAQFNFSGWGAQLSAIQWQIVQDARPDPIPLWIEGCRAQGNSASARFLGNFEGPTLRDAVINYKKTKTYHIDALDTYKLTDWGRRFFNNEADAREIFG